MQGARIGELPPSSALSGAHSRRKHMPEQAKVIVSRSCTQVMKRCAFRTQMCAVAGIDSDLDAAHSLTVQTRISLGWRSVGGVSRYGRCVRVGDCGRIGDEPVALRRS